MNVNVVFVCAHTGLGLTLNEATGAAFTTTVEVVVLLHVPLVTVKLIVLVPAVDQETLCGPAVEALAGVAPEPKSHTYVAPAAAVPV